MTEVRAARHMPSNFEFSKLLTTVLKLTFVGVMHCTQLMYSIHSVATKAQLEIHSDV